MIRPVRRAATAAIVALAVAAFVPASYAQGTAVNVLDYALSHPLDNASISNPPQLGDSVPNSVKLERPDGGKSAYGYFYYAGQPVIVDMKTRSVVRVGG